MPQASHLKKNFKAKHVFTGREKPLNTFATVLTRPTIEDYHILNYFGFGGIGKSALCEQFILLLDAKKDQNNALGWAKLDFDLEPYRRNAEALISIRLQLAEQCHIPFPAFDTAFGRYFAFFHPGRNIRDVYPSLFKQSNDVLQDMESVAGDLIDEIPGVGFFYKYLKKLSDFTQQWWQRRGKEILADLDSLESHKLLEALPKYLGVDLYDWLFDTKAVQSGEQRRLVILIDTYEDLWRNEPTKTGSDSMRVDAWVRKLVEETPGVFYIVLGRDRLKWGEDWESAIEIHRLDELSPGDADKFLRQVPIEEDDIRQAIIDASRIPFYLDLQVKQYEILKQIAGKLHASDFGGTESEIRSRFTDHLDEQLRRALQIVSHARFIDESLTQKLAQEFLGGKASIDPNKLTVYSFWKQEKSLWVMHHLMLEYLQSERKEKEPELYKQIHQFLFTHYDSQLETLEQVVDIDERHYQALNEAAYHLQQFNVQEFPEWANTRGQIFLSAYALDDVALLYNQALEVANNLLDKLNPTLVRIFNNLGVTWRDKGDYDKAIYYFEQALDSDLQSFVDGHPNVARDRNNLGLALHARGDVDEAIGYFEQALASDLQTYGEGHLNVARDRNNLGMVWQGKGDYDKAIDYFEQALDSDLQSFGEGRPHVATIRNNLGMAWKDKGEFDKAIGYFEQALDSDLQTYGEGHPEVARDRDNLGLVWQDKGEFDKAIEYYEQALASDLNTFGEEHPKVATCRNNLGIACHAKGEYEQAIGYFELALASDLKTYEEGHPNVARDRNSLGGAWNSKGKYNKAIGYYEQALASDLQTYGEEHPNVATYRNNLGMAWKDKGEFDKAIGYYDQALASDLQTYEEGHPNVARDLNNLGSAWDEKGDYDKAIDYYDQALESNLQTFGEGHPAVAKNRNNLGVAWAAKGDYDKAIGYYDQALASKLKTYGEGHPKVASARNNLGLVWYGKGDYDKAIGYFEQALASDLQTYGDGHPNVASARNNLGEVWRAKGEYDKAIDYYEQALETFKQILGEQHPNTKVVQANLDDAKEQLAETKNIKN